MNDNKKDKSLLDLLLYNELSKDQKEEVDKGNHDPWNFEEEELEDDDYYFDDDEK